MGTVVSEAGFEGFVGFTYDDAVWNSLYWVEVSKRVIFSSLQHQFSLSTGNHDGTRSSSFVGLPGLHNQ